MGIAEVSRHPLDARRHTSDQGTRRPLRSSVTATVADVGVPCPASSQAGSRVKVRGKVGDLKFEQELVPVVTDPLKKLWSRESSKTGKPGDRETRR